MFSQHDSFVTKTEEWDYMSLWMIKDDGQTEEKDKILSQSTWKHDENTFSISIRHLHCGMF